MNITETDYYRSKRKKNKKRTCASGIGRERFKITKCDLFEVDLIEF